MIKSKATEFFFRKRAISADFLQSLQNKLQKRKALRFSQQYFAYMLLYKYEISITTKNLESCLHFLAS